MLEGALLALMLDAPPPYESEAQESRRARLATIARAVEIETSPVPSGWRWGQVELAALVLATTYGEGWRWANAVHTGRKNGDCDGGGRPCRARCLGQLWRNPTFMPRAEWLASTGTDLESTRVCIAGVVRVLAHYAERCVSESRTEHDLAGSFARISQGYATGRYCAPRGRSIPIRRGQLAAKWRAHLLAELAAEAA